MFWLVLSISCAVQFFFSCVVQFFFSCVSVVIKIKIVMALLDTVDEWDNEELETLVSVHSPVIKCTLTGQFYTSYAVSLKSFNSSFTLPYSCVRRRYSEFIHLRNLLKEHHPTVDLIELPPRKYFYRFDQSFINERTEGLQNFLKRILEMPVYLSNRAVHLFLQSHRSMAEIEELVRGDVPPPRLVPVVLPSSYDSRIDTSDISTVIETSVTDINDNSEDEVDSSSIQDVEIGEEATCLLTDPTLSEETKTFSEPIPILQAYLRPLSPGNIAGSSSPRLSPTNSSTDSTNSISRRVSFCDKVKVAVVKDQSWDFGTKPIRYCAC